MQSCLCILHESCVKALMQNHQRSSEIIPNLPAFQQSPTEVEQHTLLITIITEDFLNHELGYMVEAHNGLEGSFACLWFVFYEQVHFRDHQ